jgi:TetR/AcrR family transcriptional regulator, repressor of fatR-cypB operon
MTSHDSARAYLDAGDAPGKRAILAAALELFVRSGIDGTSIRDIGAAAGLTNPALFRHFSGKEAMALHLFERIYHRLRDSLPAVDTSPFAEQLRATIDVYLRFIDEDLPAALFFQETLRRFWPQLSAAQRRGSLIAHFRELLAAGTAQRVVDGEEDQSLLLAAVVGLIGQFARQLYFGEIEGPATSRLDDIQALLLRALSLPNTRPARRRRTR